MTSVHIIVLQNRQYYRHVSNNVAFCVQIHL